MARNGRPRAKELEINGIIYQECRKCNEMRPHHCFRKNNVRHNGIDTICKNCAKKKNPKSKGRKRNPTRINEKGQKEKFCTGCNSFKTFDLFNKSIGHSYGISTRCSRCQKKKPSYQHSLDKLKQERIEANKILNQSVIDNGKVCSACHTLKPHTSFKEVKQYRDGFHKKCNDCVTKRKKELAKKHEKQKHERIMNDPVAKSIKNARRMIVSAFRYVGSKKNSRTYDVIGLNAAEFYQWLMDVSRVTPETHDVHIDHVIPISFAESKDEVLALSHFSNLQWLTHDQNIRKRNEKIKESDLFRVFEFTPYKETIEEIVNRNDLEIIGSKEKY